MTSAELLARFNAGDFNALMELYNRHHDTLVKWIRSHYSVDRSIAENSAIAAFEQVRDGLEYDGESFVDWLCTLAGNCVAAVADRIARQRRTAAPIESRFESLPPIYRQAATVKVLYDVPDDLAAELLNVTTAEFQDLSENAMAALACCPVAA
jgi:DNA-directed RNA polymerase specialized sigma24 family protein